MHSLNIAISIAITGGIGGIERNLFTLTKAMRNHFIDIYTMQFIPRGFVPQGENVTIRWFERKNDQLHITIEDGKEYDIYLYYAACNPIYIGNHLNVRKKVIIPNGNDVRGIEKHFDYVFCQATDGVRYFDDMSKKLPITPCVIMPVDRTEAVENLPEKYFLTVFNPYDRNCRYRDGFKPCKGYDLIYELADQFALPLIWCHSDQSLPIRQNIKNHSKIIHMSNLSQENLYYLYGQATAYVSFSREESFGWALADAIMFDKPIISRNVGVVSSLDPSLKGLYIYNDTDGLISFLKCRSFERGAYDKTCFSPKKFEEKLLSIARL
ncbi:MAG: glycosyltransferase [Deltaproteobacteria bacterium]|nr:glycosyltransferase [Deltaproteobacteria bacterium]